MILLVNNYQKITVYPASSGSVALSADSHLHSLGDTGRYVYFDNIFFLHYPFAITGRTFLSYGFPFSAARRANRGSLHLSEHCISQPCNMACPMACGTCRHAVSISGPSTSASLADIVFCDFYFLFCPICNFMQTKLDFNPEV